MTEPTFRTMIGWTILFYYVYWLVMVLTKIIVKGTADIKQRLKRN